jgi:hypothetical protein
VLRDALLGAFHSSVGRALAIAEGDPANTVVLNWLPDPTTLLRVLREREKEIPLEQRRAQELRVIYPGRGLSGLELDILWEFFPDLTLDSFDEVAS